jgi:hypothetical protein
MSLSPISALISAKSVLKLGREFSPGSLSNKPLKVIDVIR